MSPDAPPPTNPRFTLDELTARVARALAVGYEGQSNGQISDVPNGRTIRYYTTLGLIDRPAEMRGRTAYYGRRHLLQLVAVKRLQLEGLSLARIQERLAGTTNDGLAEIARLSGAENESTGDGQKPRNEHAGPASERQRDFWQAAPATLSDANPAPESDPGSVSVHPLVGLRVEPGLTLLLEPARRLEPADLAAIEDALTPLLQLLRERGLAPRLRGDQS